MSSYYAKAEFTATQYESGLLHGMDVVFQLIKDDDFTMTLPVKYERPVISIFLFI